jgi:1-acyl-sn-glycerol-3-phosphate acyltransferase
MRRLLRVLIILIYVIIFWFGLPCGLFLAGRWVDGLGFFPDFPEWGRWVGIPFCVLGLWLCVHASLLLRTKGKGLPISSLPPTEYVTSGPYGIWRHPIYTGFILLFFGLGLCFGSPGTALVVIPLLAIIWFATWVKLYEEPGLLRRFGASFRVHRERTTLFLPFRLRSLVRALIRLVFRLACRFQVEGSENIPASGPVIIVTDHSNYFDFMFAQYFSRRPPVIPVTAEVFRMPLKRAFMRIMGAVPKRRFCADPAAALALADELIAGGVVTLAVEGERSWTGEMAMPVSSVAYNIGRFVGRFRCTVIPAALVHSYRMWPRWAEKPNRSVQVILRLGKPIRLDEDIEGFEPGNPKQSPDIARLLRERILALRDPDEPSVDLSSFPAIRPHLALWFCPVCRAEETLQMVEKRWLDCRACGARWDTRGGDLALVKPEERAGEKDTLAGWAARAGDVPDVQVPEGEPLIAVDGVEWHEDPYGRATLCPLQCLGSGEAKLFRDRIEWREQAGAGGQAAAVDQSRAEDQSADRATVPPSKQEAPRGPVRTVPLSRIRSVTTERNNTLQLGVGQGVVQLVFDRSSPLRWQRRVENLMKQ